MKKIQRGFTLIEMVIVVVLVGTLSAVAVPKYVDYKEGAGAAAVKGVAAALSAAAVSNYTANVSLMPNAVTMTACSEIQTLLTGDLPDGMSVLAATETGNGTPASTSDAGVVTPAKQGLCKVKSSKFKATTTFPYTPIGLTPQV